MEKILIVIVLVFVLIALGVAAVPESNETLLPICYNNVEKPMYREIHKITGDPYEWCRNRYPIY